MTLIRRFGVIRSLPELTKQGSESLTFLTLLCPFVGKIAPDSTFKFFLHPFIFKESVNPPLERPLAKRVTDFAKWLT